MRKMTWNGLWTNNVRYNFKFINIIIAIEICLAFSPLGFITIDPVSLTTLQLIVIVGALWGGPVGGTLVGTVFGLCSMWKASVSGTSKSDLLYAPFRSGNPFGSIMLSVGSRALFGFFMGFIFLLLFSFIRSDKKKLIIGTLLSIVCERFHPMFVKMNLNIFFDGNYTWYSSFYTYASNMDAEKILLTFAIIVIYIGFFLYFEKMVTKEIYQVYLDSKEYNFINSQKIFPIVGLFFIFVALLLYHMIGRMQLVFGLKNMEFDIDAQIRIVNVIIQFIVALVALSALFLEYVKYIKAKNQLEIIRQKEQQAQLELEYERKANESKTVFLSTMSHDIRTPMNAIMGMTDLAVKNIDNPTKALDCLDKVKYSSENLVSLLNDILDISKIESGNINISNRNFNLRKRVDYLIDTMTPLMEKKNIKFNSNINIKEDLIVYSDELRISQIGLNLFSNAVKYAKDEIDLNVYIKDNIDPLKYNIYFEIIDNGIGMSPEFMEHMFEPFSRENDGRIDKVQGTGLGLAIVKRIVDAFSGTISVDSKQGKGSKFVVDLPVLKASDTCQSMIKNETKKEFDLSGLNILVCDDIEINYIIVSELLNEYKVNSYHANNGQECIDMLMKNDVKYDLILMDLQMPVMNGFEATKNIRGLNNEYNKIPIIAMTADAFSEDVEKCLKAGMNNHISKPISMLKLKTVIGEALE